VARSVRHILRHTLLVATDLILVGRLERNNEMFVELRLGFLFRVARRWFTPAPPSPAATSEARSRSPMPGAPPHFPPMCMTAQIRSVPRPSFPNHHSPDNQRSTFANLPVCRSAHVRSTAKLQRSARITYLVCLPEHREGLVLAQFLPKPCGGYMTVPALDPFGRFVRNGLGAKAAQTRNSCQKPRQDLAKG
jgi:hypothetical protein